MNNAAVNVPTHDFVWIYVFIFPSKYLGIALLGHMVTMFCENMLSEKNQSQKSTYYITPFIWKYKIKKSTEIECIFMVM